ncbi:MAG: PIN domain-containing protein [Verrucomicrobiota bacterium]
MAANAVFLDSSGWVALLNARDALHGRAYTLWHELVCEGHHFVFTDWIVAETANGLARTPARRRLIESWRQMQRSPRVRVVFVDSSLMERALKLYTDRADKTWGLVDCASFLVMSGEGITEAFTADRHFEQAGYARLLPVSVE